MRNTILIGVVLLLCGIVSTTGGGSTHSTKDRDDDFGSSKIKNTDDLEWLVGRWRCVTRQYFAKQEQLLGGRGEDSLDYFNVYLPYADDKLTLDLADDPELRPIAAEFLVRYVDDTGPFKEVLAPMSSEGPVRMGRDRIWYGSAPTNFEFKYTAEKRGDRLWLILESKYIRLELIKLYAKVGDLRESFVKAPVKEYSVERLSELAKKYEELKQRQSVRAVEQDSGTVISR